MRPVEAALTAAGVTAIAPEPSAAATVMTGDEDSGTNDPPAVERCCACHVWSAGVDGAVAPVPPEALDPYVIVTFCPTVRVSPETVIVCPEVETMPGVAVV